MERYFFLLIFCPFRLLPKVGKSSQFRIRQTKKKHFQIKKSLHPFKNPLEVLSKFPTNWEKGEGQVHWHHRWHTRACLALDALCSRSTREAFAPLSMLCGAVSHTVGPPLQAWDGPGSRNSDRGTHPPWPMAFQNHALYVFRLYSGHTCWNKSKFYEWKGGWTKSPHDDTCSKAFLLNPDKWRSLALFFYKKNCAGDGNNSSSSTAAAAAGTTGHSEGRICLAFCTRIWSTFVIIAKSG